MSQSPAPSGPWAEAGLAAALLAIDPPGTGGAVLRAPHGPVRDHWLALLRGLLPEGSPWRRIPVHATEARLIGGLDLAATLRAGRPVAEAGLLAESHGGIAVLAMAERHGATTIGCLAAALDRHEVVLERDGLARRLPARLGVVALDEGATPEEAVAAALSDRLAFVLDLTALGMRDIHPLPWDAAAVAAARTRLPHTALPAAGLQALCAVALELGVMPVRASLLAARVARAAAALAGRDAAADEDVATAVRLVLVPRATRLPVPETDEAPAQPEPDDSLPQTPPDEPREEGVPRDDEAMAERMIAAARAAIPDGLLALLQPAARRGPRGERGRAGARQASPRHGRPAGTRAAAPGGGARLNVVETLRAAAPWQRLRWQGAMAARPGRVQVRPEDFRVTRFQDRRETTTVFVVDASGSSALHRLAEAKGAVELLLADCYVRRDQVALVAFRGRSAELLLPPTRSLVRARRSLAGLPGGGGTPLAAGIDAAGQLATQLQRRGSTPVLVLLTDGKANVAADGAPGREQARSDALAAARQVRAAGFAALLLDTSPQPQAAARELAEAMGARYLALPHADAAAVSSAVKAAQAL
ncbi:MAG: magnesium chelatase subunit D [Rhodocyclaceae bacterium]|nr:magnesium chelatase subunit D [Rhodocyclaceae bacterium]MCA3144664.1 magnesium chelatase subunit D [Rhodocyclaceae bacterium]